MSFEVSLVAKVPRDRAYSAYTDFEAMPKWSKQTKAVTTSKRGEGVVYLESVSAVGGRRITREVNLFPPQRVESEGETRFTRTKSVVKFEEVSEGTRVTASLDIKFKGRWGWVLKTQSKAGAESSAMEELAAFAKYVESLPDH